MYYRTTELDLEKSKLQFPIWLIVAASEILPWLVDMNHNRIIFSHRQ